ncbi:hypothetical protein MRB53_023751 [Persea americana]|uniref:Uncharacterized protein n=1 Tax=Persea americana TaxID=3435 RepID=A0ACC2LAV5_PERAE|nr:hypothetical protein MRB53_023751 [Persea americana]
MLQIDEAIAIQSNENLGLSTSVRTTSSPLRSSEKRAQSPSYVDPSLPVPVRIVDPSKDLNSYGIGNVDWKERVEGWKLKQDKYMMQMTSRYTDGRGDMEGTGSNGEDLQMYVLTSS